MQHEAPLGGDFILAQFDAFIDEFIDLAATGADQVIVVLALVQLEDRLGNFKVVAFEQTGLFKLGQHPIHRGEADIVIALERPEHGPYVCCKLCDYRLQLYATQEYLDKHPAIRRPADLSEHSFISYVDDLAFSSELLYLANVVPGASASNSLRA